MIPSLSRVPPLKETTSSAGAAAGLSGGGLLSLLPQSHFVVHVTAWKFVANCCPFFKCARMASVMVVPWKVPLTLPTRQEPSMVVERASKPGTHH